MWPSMLLGCSKGDICKGCVCSLPEAQGAPGHWVRQVRRGQGPGDRSKEPSSILAPSLEGQAIEPCSLFTPSQCQVQASHDTVPAVPKPPVGVPPLPRFLVLLLPHTSWWRPRGVVQKGWWAQCPLPREPQGSLNTSPPRLCAAFCGKKPFDSASDGVSHTHLARNPRGTAALDLRG